MKKIVLILTALCGFFIAGNAQATCSNYATYSDGQVLTSSSLNSLQTNYTNCVNSVLDGDTFTGTINLQSGSDLNIYSDAGATLKAKIAGATGTAIIANKSAPFFSNLNLANATTTDANDTIRIQCGNASCSASNPGLVVLQSPTAGQINTVFSVTSDVDLKLTGTQWVIGGTDNDVTGAIVRVFAVNDNGSLRWCAGYLSGRNALLTTDTSSTQTDINTAEELFCNVAVSSASNRASEFGWVRADYDYTGGAHEKLWAVQTGVNDINLGSADGYWQTWKPGFTGFSVIPTVSTARFTQVGRLVQVFLDPNAMGTSNSTSFSITGPVKFKSSSQMLSGGYSHDNSSTASTPGGMSMIAGSSSLTMRLTVGSNGSSWTNSGNKGASLNFSAEVGPAASFLE